MKTLKPLPTNAQRRWGEVVSPLLGLVFACGCGPLFAFWFVSRPFMASDGRIPLPLLLMPICLLLPAAVFAVVMAGMFLRNLQFLLASMEVTAPEVSISSHPLHAGEVFTVRYQQAFQRPANVQRLVLRLVRQEVLSSMGDTETRPLNEVVQEVEFPGRRFEAGDVFAGEGALQIPAEALPSADAPYTRARWLIQTEVSTAKGAGVQEVFEIKVVSDRPY